MQKTIEVTVKLTSDTTFDMEFHEPESGDFNRISGCDSDGIELNKAIAAELRSWVSLMRDEQEDDEDGNGDDEECHDICQYLLLTKPEAITDIFKYLKSQSDDYFEARSTTLQQLLKNENALEAIVGEHMRCVNRYGCDREWSCQDACDNDPGFYPEEN